MSAQTTRVDAHVKVLSDRVCSRAKDRGLDALVYAPHFRRLPNIERRADRFADEDLAIIPGRELFAGSWRNRKHVLALDLEAPIPDFISLEGAMAELDRQDAAVLAPHPGFATVSLGAEDIEAFLDQIDAIETYNPKNLPHNNRRADRLASDLRLPAFGSSYAHLPGTVGEAWTEFLDVEPSEGAIIEALTTRVPRTVERRRHLAHHGRRVLEFGHLGFENTWQKFDRVVLSGMEATHPNHPAYEGRFDDVSVY